MLPTISYSHRHKLFSLIRLRYICSPFARSAGVFTACICVAICIPLAAYVQEKQDETITAIRDAALRREQKAQTLKVGWKERTNYYAVAGARRRGRPVVTATSNDNVDVTCLNTVTIDGARIRFAWNRSDGINTLSAFDGQTYRMIDTPTSSHQYPRGRVVKALNPDITMMALKPILMEFRLINPAVRAFQLTKFKVVDRNAVLDGHKCVLINDDDTGAANIESMWLDPARDYLVLRNTITNRRTSAESRRLDISYLDEPTVGWVPSGWSLIASRQRGVPFMSITAEVTEFTINDKIPAELFQLTFPPNTMVTDSDGDKHRYYIIRSDGTQSAVAPEELASKTHEQLLASRPQESTWSRIRWLFLIVNVVVVVAIGVYMIYAKWRHGLAT